MKKILALIKEYIRYFFTQLKNRINKTFKSMEGAVVTHSFLSIAASFLVCVIVSSVVLFEIGGDFDSKEKEYQDYSYIDDYTEVDIANFSKEEYDYYLEHHKLETDDLTGSLEIKDLPDRIIDNEEINQPVVLTWDEAIIQLNESIDNSQASIEHPQTLSVMQIGGNEVIAEYSISDYTGDFAIDLNKAGLTDNDDELIWYIAQIDETSQYQNLNYSYLASAFEGNDIAAAPVFDTVSVLETENDDNVLLVNKELSDDTIYKVFAAKKNIQNPIKLFNSAADLADSIVYSNSVDNNVIPHRDAIALGSALLDTITYMATRRDSGTTIFYTSNVDDNEAFIEEVLDTMNTNFFYRPDTVENVVVKRVDSSTFNKIYSLLKSVFPSKEVKQAQTREWAAVADKAPWDIFVFRYYKLTNCSWLGYTPIITNASSEVTTGTGSSQQATCTTPRKKYNFDIKYSTGFRPEEDMFPFNNFANEITIGVCAGMSRIEAEVYNQGSVSIASFLGGEKESALEYGIDSLSKLSFSIANDIHYKTLFDKGVGDFGEWKSSLAADKQSRFVSIYGDDIRANTSRMFTVYWYLANRDVNSFENRWFTFDSEQYYMDPDFFYEVLEYLKQDKVLTVHFPLSDGTCHVVVVTGAAHVSDAGKGNEYYMLSVADSNTPNSRIVTAVNDKLEPISTQHANNFIFFRGRTVKINDTKEAKVIDYWDYVPLGFNNNYRSRSKEDAIKKHAFMIFMDENGNTISHVEPCFARYFVTSVN